MLRLSCTVAFLAFADGALLRKASLQIEGDPKSPEEIHKKWDKMDDFLETMFVMACNSKHGKDVNGLAAEKLKSGDIVGSKALKSFKTKTQDANVDGVFRACGMIVSKGKKKCRESCSTRFGTMSSEVMQERADCDKMCVERYASFEKSCRSKADNLKTVYDIKNKMAEAKKQCHESHCAKYPTVWMKEKDDMSAEVDSQCEKACTEDRVKVQCEHKFNLEIDFQMAKIKSDCQAEGKVSECFSKEKESLSGEADTCSSKGKSDCDDSHSKCDTDKNSGDFCNERKKMCLEQVDKNCLKKT